MAKLVESRQPAESRESLAMPSAASVRADGPVATASPDKESLFDEFSLSRTAFTRPRGCDRDSDGSFLLPNGKFASVKSNIDDIPKFSPRRRTLESEEPIIAVNGVANTPHQVSRWATVLAGITGKPIVPIYNLTFGMVSDVAQAMGDRMNLARNPCVQSLTSIVAEAVRDGRPLHIIAHSQGALIVSQALFEVSSQLEHVKKLNPEQVAERLSAITVETLGGAAPSFPKGPKYRHFVHEGDPVAVFLGVTPAIASSGAMRTMESQIQASWLVKSIFSAIGGTLNPLAKYTTHPGEGAEVLKIKNEKEHGWQRCHSVSTYLSAYRKLSKGEEFDRHVDESPPGTIADGLKRIRSTFGGTGIVGVLTKISSAITGIIGRKTAPDLSDGALDG